MHIYVTQTMNLLFWTMRSLLLNGVLASTIFKFQDSLMIFLHFISVSFHENRLIIPTRCTFLLSRLRIGFSWTAVLPRQYTKPDYLIFHICNTSWKSSDCFNQMHIYVIQTKNLFCLKIQNLFLDHAVASTICNFHDLFMIFYITYLYNFMPMHIMLSS